MKWHIKPSMFRPSSPDSVAAISIICGVFLSYSAFAQSEQWHCELKELPTSALAPQYSSVFVYDIRLIDPLTAQIEISPLKLGVNEKDDAEAGTAIVTVLQNTKDGIVLGGGSTGPTAYGRGAYGAILALNRRANIASASYVLAGEKAAFGNPPRVGKCSKQ